MWTAALAFAVFLVVIFVIVYIVADNAQGYLYNEKATRLPWRVLGASLGFAALAAAFGTTVGGMFTEGWLGTVIQVAVWIVVFLLLLEFEVVHALLFAPAAMLLSLFLAATAVESLTRSPAEMRAQREGRYSRPNPIRKAAPPTRFTPDSLKGEPKAEAPKAETNPG